MMGILSNFPRDAVVTSKRSLLIILITLVLLSKNVQSACNEPDQFDNAGTC